MSSDESSTGRDVQKCLLNKKSFFDCLETSNNLTSQQQEAEKHARRRTEDRALKEEKKEKREARSRSIRSIIIPVERRTTNNFKTATNQLITKQTKPQESCLPNNI